MEQLNCAAARQMDLVSYLQALGFAPRKIRGGDYWYCSPLRVEKTPSFKVDRTRNIWYDHGIGKGGNLIDFGLLYHHCTVGDLLVILAKHESFCSSYSPGLLSSQTQDVASPPKIQVLDVEALADKRLLSYVASRQISFHLAQQYLRQLQVRLGGKIYTTLGFRNNSGGFELRNRHFKGSSSPKDLTLFQKKDEMRSISVFEGFFSFLSYLQLLQGKEDLAVLKNELAQSCFLVLNSLSFLEKSRALMEQHSQVQLYLDRDEAGRTATQKAIRWSAKYEDRSCLYEGHKDLNVFLCSLKSQRHVLSLKQRPKGRRM